MQAAADHQRMCSSSGNGSNMGWGGGVVRALGGGVSVAVLSILGASRIPTGPFRNDRQGDCFDHGKVGACCGTAAQKDRWKTESIQN